MEIINDNTLQVVLAILIGLIVLRITLIGLLYANRDAEEDHVFIKLFGYCYVNIFGLFLKTRMNKKIKKMASMIGVFSIIVILMTGLFAFNRIAINYNSNINLSWSSNLFKNFDFTNNEKIIESNEKIEDIFLNDKEIRKIDYGNIVNEIINSNNLDDNYKLDYCTIYFQNNLELKDGYISYSKYEDNLRYEYYTQLTYNNIVTTKDVIKSKDCYNHDIEDLELEKFVEIIDFTVKNLIQDKSTQDHIYISGSVWDCRRYYDYDENDDEDSYYDECKTQYYLINRDDRKPRAISNLNKLNGIYASIIITSIDEKRNYTDQEYFYELDQ